MNIESGHFTQDGQEGACKARKGALRCRYGKLSVLTEKCQERPETGLKRRAWNEHY